MGELPAGTKPLPRGTDSKASENGRLDFKAGHVGGGSYTRIGQDCAAVRSAPEGMDGGFGARAGLLQASKGAAYCITACSNVVRSSWPVGRLAGGLGA